MEFGIDKCRTHSINSRRLEFNNYTLEAGMQIQSMEEEETYKYLGYQQSSQINHKETKEQLTKKISNTT